MTITRTLLALAALATLSGCISILPESEPAQVYRLATPAHDRSGPEADAAPVVVERPTAPRALSGSRVALAYPDGRIAYLSGVSWASPAPSLLEYLILDTFDARHGAVAAARPADGVSTRWRLQLELRHFEAVYDQGETAPPLAKIMVRARLVDLQTRALASVRAVETSARAQSNTVTDIMAAFDEAAQAAAREIVAETGRAVGAADQAG